MEININITKIKHNPILNLVKTSLINIQQIIINTPYFCHTFICNRHCFQILSSKYIIISTHNITTLTITLFNPFSLINSTLISYNFPI
jgi:hypothetical protein